MKKIIRYVLISIVFMTIMLLIFSCAMNSSYFTGTSLEDGNKSFRESFLKVENRFSIKECNKEDKCKIERIISSASAFIVNSGQNGAYAITAAHFCEDDMDLILRSLVQGKPVKKIEYYAYDIDMKKYNVNIINYDTELDLCLIYIKKLKRKATLISQNPPEPGDKVYNLAAPLGTFGSNLIPKLDGYYAGSFRKDGKKDNDRNVMSLYSVPAIGGSSGSPIFDKNGYVVGMIHSVNTRFPFLIYSPTQTQLKHFINENVPY